MKYDVQINATGVEVVLTSLMPALCSGGLSVGEVRAIVRKVADDDALWETVTQTLRGVAAVLAMAEAAGDGDDQLDDEAV